MLFVTIIAIITVNMAFFNVIDFQAALGACLTVCDWETKPFSPIYLEEMKKVSKSRTVSQLIMRVHEP